jgi:hypothetical protein
MITPFLQERPDMVNNPALTRLACGLTLQAGIERNSPDFAAAMEGNFTSLLNRAQAQAQPQPAAVNPAAQPASTPEFFRPPPPPARSAPSPAAFVSAPVSRGTPSAETGYRPARQVKLTPEEQEWARISGLSDVEYARHRQRLDFEKKTGQRQ